MARLQPRIPTASALGVWQAGSVISPAASLDWVRENLRHARASLSDEQSADHVVGCEWMESLEAWKMAVDARSLDDLTESQKNFDVETKQVIATMIRFWQLGMKTIVNHKAELEGKGDR